jgi:hypothetical protein
MSQEQVCIFKISMKYSFFSPNWDYFKQINLRLRRAIFLIFQHKNQKKREAPQNKEKYLSKIVLHIFC